MPTVPRLHHRQPGSIPSEPVSRTFPGCQIVDWTSVGKVSGKVAEAVEFITSRFEERPNEPLPFATVMNAICMIDRSNFNRSIRKPDGFMQRMRDLGVEKDGAAKFIYLASGFEVIEGGYSADGE